MRRLYTIILLLFAQIIVVAQDVTITASFDTTRILIGDHINYSVVVDQPADYKLYIPVLTDTICADVEILEGPFQDTVAEGDRLRVINRYLVTAFDSGLHVARPIFAELADDNGIKRFYSGYAPLQVMRVTIAPMDTTAAYYDIIDPYKAPVTFDEVIPWILLAILIGLACYGLYKMIYYFAKKKVKEEEKEVVVPVEPAHVIAFRELDILKEEELWQKGKIKEYYTRLSEILRQYLDNRYGINSMELTTKETLAALKAAGFKQDINYSNLEKLLEGSDLVKFAKHQPDSEEHDLHFNNTRKFVEDTMEKPVVTQPNNNTAAEKEVKS